MKFKVKIHIESGGKITMCRFLREVSGCSLKDAVVIADTFNFDQFDTFTLVMNSDQTAKLAEGFFNPDCPLGNLIVLSVEEVKNEGTDICHL